MHVDSTGNLLLEDHPTGRWAWWSIYQNVFFFIILAIGLAWIVAQIPGYRRATGVRRAQLKWLMAGAAAALVGGLVTTTGHNGSGVFAVIGFLGTLALLGLPIGIGIGIPSTGCTTSTG